MRRNQNFPDVDTRLPHLQGILDVVPGQTGGRRFVGGEDQIVNTAAEFGTHDALPNWRQEDHADRLFDVALLTRQGDAPARVDSRPKRPPGANYVYPFAHSHASPPLPHLAPRPLAFLLSAPA